MMAKSDLGSTSLVATTRLPGCTGSRAASLSLATRDKYKEQDLLMVEPINPQIPGCTVSPMRVVIAVEMPGCPSRRQVVLNEDYLNEPDPPACAAPQVPTPTRQRLTCLGLVERIIGHWGATLRAPLLLIVLLVLISMIIVGLGLEGALFVPGISVVMTLVQRPATRAIGL